MTFTPGSFNFGSASSGAAAGVTRGRLGGSFHGMSYPNPFFDVAHTYLPTSIKSMFRYCRYYFLTNPLINATVFKLSEYPITDLEIDHEDGKVKRRWTEYFHDHLQYRSFQVSTGLDYYAMGNCAVSLSYPFHKYVTCRHCKWSERAARTRPHWRFTNFEFRLSCPKCRHVGDAEVFDHYYRDASGIKPIRWNVEDVEVTYNDVTGESTYFYTIPASICADVVVGKKDVVEGIPQLFIGALKQRKGVIFNKDNFFHLKRPTIAWQDRGWGIPIILPVLKDTFHLQIMKKAQEAVLLEHVVPLRAIFPQAGSASTDPFTTLNLVDWKEQMAAEIARWRWDSQYIPILPIPIGHQSIGGDGKVLLLFNEMSALSEHIIMGLGVPREFLQGGLSYSGTNVSMRMLENAFIGYVSRQRAMARWVMKSVATYMEWPEATIRFKPFKMADDLQRKAYFFQLNAAGKLSDTTLLADSDLDQADENEIMIREADKRIEGQKKQQLAAAEIQGEAQMIMMKYQAKAQAGQMAMQDPMAQMGSGLGEGSRLDGQPGMDLTVMAQHYAQQIGGLAASEKQQALQAIAAQSPELGQLVQQMLGAQAPQGGAMAVDSRPLPAQRPPTRQATSV